MRISGAAGDGVVLTVSHRAVGCYRSMITAPATGPAALVARDAAPRATVR